MVNQVPVDWYTERQSTVETATYGSEFMAAITAKEQITAMRLTLRYLEVPIRGSIYLFGDSQAVVDISELPHSRLHSRHQMLSYH